MGLSFLILLDNFALALKLCFGYKLFIPQQSQLSAPMVTSHHTLHLLVALYRDAPCHLWKHERLPLGHKQKSRFVDASVSEAQVDSPERSQ